MKLIKLFLAVGLLVITGLIVQENIAHTVSMHVFGNVLFRDTAVPIVVLVSFFAGMVIMLPFALRSKKSPNKKKFDEFGNNEADE